MERGILGGMKDTITEISAEQEAFFTHVAGS
jgi:hypothetical protein